ncbi:MAG: hypothetical protein J5548_02950 [Prevotella sp.]|nr:hypothetical protein [Prevotella sp.]
MKKETIAGFALFLTIMALVVFAYISFLGMEYLFEGNHLLTIPLLLLGGMLLSWCIRVMCRSKASRDKRSGLPKEVSAIIGAIAILLVGSVAFTQFLFVYDHQKELRESMFATIGEVSKIDSVYKDYAQSRIKTYDKTLKKAHDKDRSEKKRSLKRRLIPADYDTICVQRKQWLASINDASVWNVSTPRNLHYIVTAGHDWTEEYKQVSAVIYQNEEAIPFGEGDTAFTQSEANLQFSTPHMPNGRSLVATVLCCLLILTTYFHVRRPKSWYVGNHR